MKKTKVAHVITRLIIGGAQENTIYTVLGLQTNTDFEVDLISGEEIGPEGRLDISEIKNCIFLKPLKRNINLFQDLIAFWHLYRLFKKREYDIVHTHSAKAGILGRIAAYFARVPKIIHTIHGLPFHPYQSNIKNKIFIFLEKICARFSNKIIVVTDQMTVKSLALNIGNPSLYKTIYSGMELNQYFPNKHLRDKSRQELDILPEQIVVGKIARFFDLKGHDSFFKAAFQLVKTIKNIKFLMVGDGLLLDSFKKEVERKGLQANFHFTGLILPKNIPKYLSIMDILVHTSLREGLARVLPQGLACEKAIVTFDIDGAKDLIKNGKNGFLVNPGDIKDLICKTLQLAQDAELRKSFTHNAKETVDPFFKKEYMVDQIIQIYSE